MKHYVFIPIVELEFWLLFSIAKNLKELYPERKQTLIFLSHKRLQNRFKNEKKHFDEVIEFEWFQPSIRHGLKTIILSYKFSILLSKKFNRNTSFICCGFQQFIHHHILKHLSSKQLSYVNIQLYPSEKKTVSKTLNWRFTIINSIFFFIRFQLFSKYYNLKKSEIISNISYAYLFKKWTIPEHTILNINHDFHPYQNCSYIDNVPNPYIYLNFQATKKNNLNPNSILILLADDIAQETPNYYVKVSFLIDYIHHNFSNITIYLKFHPQIQDNFEAITTKDYQPLDKTISAEHLFMANPNKINAVLGSYSTALAISTDFGISTYDCSKFFEIANQDILETYKNKHYINKPIIYINTQDDLSKITPSTSNKLNLNKTNLLDSLSKL
tara:strand:- start:10 stop:1164 length:1155 start_codon:yes stop_codon:yes gene_type:complete